MSESQVRSECLTCKCTPVTGTGTDLRRFLCPLQEIKGGGSKGGGGAPALAGTREYEQSDRIR